MPPLHLHMNPDCEDTVLDDRSALVYGKVLGRVTPDMIPAPEEQLGP